MNWNNVKTFFRNHLHFDIWEKFLNGVVFLAAVLFVLLLVQFVLSSLIWPTWFLQSATAEYDLNKLGLLKSNTATSATISIKHPVILPYGQPVDFDLIYQPNTQVVSAFQLEIVSLSPDIRFLSSSGKVPTDRIVQSFLVDEEKMVSLPVVNRHPGWGILAGSGAFLVRLLDTSNQVIPVRDTMEPIQVNLETPLISVMRNFQSTEIGQNSPLYLTATGVIALGTFFYQRLQKKKQEEKDELENKKKEAEQNLRTLRSHLVEGNPVAANKKLQEMQKSGLDKFLNAEDMERARRLIDIGLGQSGSFLFWSELPMEWVDETAGTLIYIAGNNKLNKWQVSAILRGFPVDRCSAVLADGIIAVRRKLQMALPIQEREWPLGASEKDRKKPPRLPGTALFDPFPADRAELEMRWLFIYEKPLIWRAYPLYETLVDSTATITCVTGSEGSGKSALALALGQYEDSERVMGVSLRDCPEITNIYSALGLRLLEFIRKHPTYLGYLEAHERALLVELLGRYSTPTSLHAQIDSMAHPDTWGWLGLAKDEGQKNMWETEAQTQLRLLRQALEKAGGNTLPEREWPTGFQHVCQALQFNKIRLVFDIGFQHDTRWIEGLLKNYAPIWSLAGIQAILCLPDHTVVNWQKSGLNLEENFPVERLCWIEGQNNWLSEMVHFRWEMWNSPANIDSYTQGKLPELFDRANGSPRAFIREWRKFVA